MGVILIRRKRRRSRAPAVAFGVAFAGAASTAAYFIGRRPQFAGRRRDQGAADALGHEFRCECGQEFRVSGADRHRVFWLPEAGPDDPVLDDRCPNCERVLSMQD